MNNIFKFLIVIHKFSPFTIDIQSVLFSVSYFKLTIVFIIPYGKINKPVIEIISNK